MLKTYSLPGRECRAVLSFFFVALTFVPINTKAQWVRLNSPISGRIVTVGNVLLLTDDETLYRSTDSGFTWQLVDSMPSPICEWMYLFAHGSDAYLTTGTCGIFYSKDSGQRWENAQTGYDNFFEPFAIGNRLFVGVLDDGIWESVDSGIHWYSIKAQEPNCHFGYDTSAFCWAMDSNYLFVGATPFGGVYRSSDSAITWDRVLSLPFDTGIWAITANGRFIVALALVSTGQRNVGLYRSTDFGNSWGIEENALTSRFIRTLATYNNIMFAGGDFGVFISQDNGATWTDANEDSTNGTIISFTSLGPYVYASGGGNTWRRLFSDFDKSDVASLIPSSFSVSIFPSITPGLVTVHSSTEIKNITVTNVLGIIVLEKKLGSSDVQLDLSQLSTGTYFARIITKDGISMQKIIRE